MKYRFFFFFIDIKTNVKQFEGVLRWTASKSGDEHYLHFFGFVFITSCYWCCLLFFLLLLFMVSFFFPILKIFVTAFLILALFFSLIRGCSPSINNNKYIRLIVLFEIVLCIIYMLFRLYFYFHVPEIFFCLKLVCF